MNRLHLLFYSFLILLITGCDSQQKSADLQWRGPNRDGIFNEENLLDTWPDGGPKLLWSYDSLGAGHSSAAFGGGKVFTLGTKVEDSLSFLFAFNLEGELLLKKELGKAWMKTWPAQRATPLIHDGRGYIFDALGVMHCFDVSDGSMIWKRALIGELTDRNSMHGVHENLVIEGEKLFCTVGGEEHNVVALNKNTGETIWSSKGIGEMNAYCSPTIINHNGTKYYVTMTFNALLAINIETGELAWSQELTEPKFGIHASVPLYHDGQLYIIDGYRYGSKMFKIAEDGLSATLLWENDTVGPQMGDAVRIGDDLFVSSAPKKKWFCLDWKTGTVKFSTDKMSTGTVIAADGKLFIQDYRGKLAMVKVENDDFTILGELQLPSSRGDHYSQPVIKDGKLYVRYMGEMAVYDIKKKS